MHLGASAMTLPSFGPIGIVNLEGPLGEGAEDSSERRLVNAMQSVASLRASGVLVAGVANNHAHDLGDLGVEATVRALERAGLHSAGLGHLALIRAGAFKIAVTAHDLSSGVPGNLAAELRDARAAADLLIATFHVTAPRTYLPPKELQQAAAIAVGAGALVVAAHGTHQVARINRVGKAIVAYGLGNFAFSCACGGSNEGLVLKVRLSADRVEDVEVIPIDPGDATTPPRESSDPKLLFDLLRSLESDPEFCAR